MQFYKRWIGAFMRKTMHLSLMEKGAYALLLDHYYASEQPLPDDIVVLFRVTGAVSEVEQSAVRKVVAEFFPLSEDGLRHNPRADEEIAQARALSEGASRAAKKRWGNRNEDAA